MTAPRLYLIGPRSLFPTDAAWLDAIERVAAAVSGFVALPAFAAVSAALQVRIEVDGDAERLAALARDRARRAFSDLALYLNAACGVPGYDGVHWPERRIPESAGDQRPSQRRSRRDSTRGAQRAADSASVQPCGASVHSLAALRRAEEAGADFAVFGPVWSPTWKEAPPQGLDALSELAASARIPILAIGGITSERAGSCLRAGAAGVAVASGVFEADDATAALAAYGRAVTQALEASPG